VAAYSDALNAVFWVQVGLAVATMLACMGMREVHLPDKGPGIPAKPKTHDDDENEAC